MSSWNISGLIVFMALAGDMIYILRQSVFSNTAFFRLRFNFLYAGK